MGFPEEAVNALYERSFRANRRKSDIADLVMLPAEFNVQVHPFLPERTIIDIKRKLAPFHVWMSCIKSVVGARCCFRRRLKNHVCVCHKSPPKRRFYSFLWRFTSPNRWKAA